MRIVSGKIVPDYIVDDNLNLIPFDDISRSMRRVVISHSQHVSFMNGRPFMKEKLDNTETIMKLDSGFSGKEFSDIVKHASEKGLVVQWDVQRIHGGSQGARAPGKIEIGREQVGEKILRRLGMWRAYNKLPLNKRMDRLHKVFGTIDAFKEKPRVKIGEEVDHTLDGLIFAREDWMRACGIPFGAKTTLATKGLLVPAPLKDCDILLPSNSNKWELSEKGLSNNIRWVRAQSPEYAFSRNLNRWPTAKFDLLALLQKIPGKNFDIDLSRQRNIVENGEYEIDDIFTMFGYKNSKGEEVLRDEGLRILLGENIHSYAIWKEVEPIVGKWMIKALQPTVRGFYGIAMPMNILPIGAEKYDVWLTRWPWIMPIRTTVGVHEHCIFVDEELMKLFGGDYDRDQVACFYRQDIDNGFEWPKDRKVLEELFQQPEKNDADFEDGWNEYDVIAYQLDQYNGCGIVYNNSRIALDIARVIGHSKEEVREKDIKLTSTKVQPFIDGFKYAGHDSDPPSIEDLLKEVDIQPVGIDLDKYSDLFRMFRSRNGSDIINLTQIAELADEESPSFYEQLLCIFKGLKIPELIPTMVDKNVDIIVKQSYMDNMHKENVQEERFKDLINTCKTLEDVSKILVSCFSRGDMGLARHILNELRKVLTKEKLTDDDTEKKSWMEREFQELLVNIKLTEEELEAIAKEVKSE